MLCIELCPPKRHVQVLASSASLSGNKATALTWVQGGPSSRGISVLVRRRAHEDRRRTPLTAEAAPEPHLWARAPRVSPAPLDAGSPRKDSPPQASGAARLPPGPRASGCSTQTTNFCRLQPPQETAPAPVHTHGGTVGTDVSSSRTHSTEACDGVEGTGTGTRKVHGQTNPAPVDGRGAPQA